MSSGELDKILDSSKLGSLDSEGEFTLSPAKALEKLAPFQLTDPGLWVVKLVQAGVRNDVESMEFRFGRQTTELRHLGGQFICAHALFEEVHQGGLPRDPALRHLVTGLRAIIGQKPARVRWGTRDGQFVSIEDGQVETGKDEKLPPNVSFRVIVKLRALARFKLFSQTASEYRALCDRCSLCPIPVYADRRLISGQSAFPPPIQKNRHCLASLLTSNQDDQPSMRLANPPQLDQVSLRPQADSTKAWVPSECGMLVALTYGGRPCAEVAWLKDGVLTETRPLAFRHEWVSVLVVLPGDDIKVDLTEFSVHGAALQDHMEPIFSALDQIMHELWAEPGLLALAQPKKIVTANDWKASGNLISGVGGGGGGKFTAPAMALAGMVAAGYLALRATANVVSNADGTEALNTLGSALDKYKMRYREDLKRLKRRPPWD